MKNPTPAPRTDPHTKRTGRDPVRSAPGMATRSVRWAPCPLCGAPAGAPCRVRPERSDHLYRWLDAYSAARITRDQLTAEIVRLVVVTKWCVIPERSE